MGSDRLKSTLAKKHAERKPAFVAYTTAGYPTLEVTVDVLLGYALPIQTIFALYSWFNNFAR